MDKHDSQLVGQDYDNKCIIGYSRKDERSTACSIICNSHRIPSNLGLVSCLDCHSLVFLIVLELASCGSL